MPTETATDSDQTAKSAAALDSARESVYERIAAACFFGSGFLALTYEVCWIRKASLVFGAAAFALSTVLAVFFGGLALGSYFFGRYCTRTSRPLRVYAWLEVGVGVLALLSPVAFRVADTVFGSIYPLVDDSFVMLSLGRFLFLTLILLPPTILMGGTFPLFCRQFVRSERRIGGSVGFLYGLNTIGAAAGCALCGFWLIPLLGVNATIYVAGVANIVLGFVALQIPLSVEQEGESAGSSTESNVAQPQLESQRRSVVYGLFFLTGFVALGYEVLWTRFLSLLMFNNVYTYTLTLTVVLVGIVLGAFLTARFSDVLRRPALAFGAAQLANGVTVLTVLMLPKSFWSSWGHPEQFATQVWIVLLVLLTPALLSGISFPLAIRMVVSDPREAGIGVGRMTAINTAGGITGSLAVGFVALPLLGMQGTLLLSTGLCVLIGITAWLTLDRSTSLPLKLALVVVVGGIWLAVPSLSGTHLPQDYLAGNGELIDFREGHNAHMAVLRDDDVLTLEIDRMWQGENRKLHQMMAAHVPMLLHRSPQSVAVIGLGAGQTAGRFLMYPIDRLDCVDIEGQLVPLVRKHFDNGWMDDSRAHFIVEDGRNYLSHTNETYDVISVEIGQLFRPGLAGFYTTEFYQAARDRLNPDGVLCQFLPILFFSPDEFRTVVRSFIDAFPQAAVWYNDAELLLIGVRGDQLELSDERLHLIETNPQLREDLDFQYWGKPDHRVAQRDVFLGGFLLGPSGLEALTGDAPPYRDDRPYLEYTTAAQRYTTEAVASLIQKHLEPVQTVYDGPLDEQSEAAIQKTQRQNLGDIVAKVILGAARDPIEREDRDEAIALLKRAVQWNPDNVDANRTLAAQLEASGLADESIPYWQHTVVLDPQDADSRDRLGGLLLAANRLEEAVIQFEQVVRERPRDEIAQNNLGNALALLGKHDRAIEHYRAALAIDENLAETHNNLGNALKEIGRVDEAISHYRRGLELDEELLSARRNLGLALAEQELFEESAEQFRSLLQRQPGNAALHSDLATVLLKWGRVNEAVEQFERAMELDPNNIQLRRKLGAARKAKRDAES